MRITLDTNILVRAACSPGGPAMRLLESIRRKHTLVSSEFIVDELNRVLQYPRIRARYGLTAIYAETFAAQTAGAAYMVELPGIRPAVSSDPDDDPILYTAAAGKSDVLCTLNTRHFRTASGS